MCLNVMRVMQASHGESFSNLEPPWHPLSPSKPPISEMTSSAQPQHSQRPASQAADRSVVGMVPEGQLCHENQGWRSILVTASESFWDEAKLRSVTNR